jgi:hypothetical protein
MIIRDMHLMLRHNSNIIRYRLFEKNVDCFTIYEFFILLDLEFHPSTNVNWIPVCLTDTWNYECYMYMYICIIHMYLQSFSLYN